MKRRVARVILCGFKCKLSMFTLHCSQMKGLNFPGSHDPAFCQFVIDRSKHLLKPVRLKTDTPLLPIVFMNLDRYQISFSAQKF